MNSALAWLAVQNHRAYIYRTLVTLGPVAIFYGLLSSEEVALWLGVASQTLGLGLATYHTPTVVPDDHDDNSF